jgi:hypothetical protein
MGILPFRILDWGWVLGEQSAISILLCVIDNNNFESGYVMYFLTINTLSNHCVLLLK